MPFACLSDKKVWIHLRAAWAELLRLTRAHARARVVRANSVEVIVAQTDTGRGILGVIDGASPVGVEGEDGVAWRKELLRTIGYKL